MYDMMQCDHKFARVRKMICCENLKGITIHGDFWASDETLPTIDFKLSPGIKTIELKYAGDSGSMTLNDLLEQCRNIKRLVNRCSINAYF